MKLAAISQSLLVPRAFSVAWMDDIASRQSGFDDRERTLACFQKI
jgi:hypothetical protein